MYKSASGNVLLQVSCFRQYKVLSFRKAILLL